MSDTHVEFGKNQAGDVELFEGDLPAFFHFGFVFAVFGIFKFYCRTDTAGFKFDFGAENPFRGKFVIESHDKTGYRHGSPMLPRVSVIRSRKTVAAVIHEIRQHFAVAAETEFAETVVIGGSIRCRFQIDDKGIFFSGGSRRGNGSPQGKQQNALSCNHKIVR